MLRFAFSLLAALLFLVTHARAEVALLQQGVSDASGPNAAYDSHGTYISINKVNGQFTTASARQNWGAGIFTVAGSEFGGRSHSLFRFDLSSMQGRADAVTSARLTLTLRRITIDQVALDPAAIDVRLYPIAPANAAWLEGNGTGQIADAVVWDGLQGPAAPWAGQPGCSAANTDYLTSPAVILPIAESFTPGAKWTFPIADTALVENWIQNPASNAGFLLRAEAALAVPDNAIAVAQFHSDDAATAAFRPLLEIQFTVPDTPTTTTQTAAHTAWLAAN